MGFETLLGNERLKDNLRSSINRGRISHFYLISGPAGSGKRTLARLLAAAILCRSQEKPCGTCPACRKVLGAGHPDFITIDGRMMREPAFLLATKVFHRRGFAFTVRTEKQYELCKSRAIYAIFENVIPQ